MTKYKFLSVLWIAFVVPGILCAQSTEKSLLWEISGKGLAQPSYLYGTIHVIKKSDFTVPEKVKTAFGKSKTLAQEIDLDMDMKTKIEVAKQTILPENKTIKDYMTEKDYARLKTYVLDSVKMKEKKFNKYSRLKPFYFSSAVLQEQMGETESYEQTFNKMAKKNKMKIMGLESVQYQIQTISKVSIEDQVKMLNTGLYETGPGSFDKMVKAYKEEDVQALYTMIAEETDDIPNFNQDFLVTRNKNWIPVINKQIAAEPTFIAVGAGHLGGPEGVIELLKKEGYTVRPIK